MKGPVPGGLLDAELLEVRARYLAAPAETTFGAWAGTDPSLEAVNDLRRWRATIADHESDELILWFEHDLFDQFPPAQPTVW